MQEISKIRANVAHTPQEQMPSQKEFRLRGKQNAITYFSKRSKYGLFNLLSILQYFEQKSYIILILPQYANILKCLVKGYPLSTFLQNEIVTDNKTILDSIIKGILNNIIFL